MILIPPSHHLLYHCCHSFYLYISTHKYIIKYTAIIILDKLSGRSTKKKKNKNFILPSFILSLILFLSLCKSEFLTYIISLLSMELLLTLLARQVYWQQTPSTLVCLRVFISLALLKDNCAGHRILDSRVFYLNALNISYHSLLACIVSEEKLDIILMFASV